MDNPHVPNPKASEARKLAIFHNLIASYLVTFKLILSLREIIRDGRVVGVMAELAVVNILNNHISANIPMINVISDTLGITQEVSNLLGQGNLNQAIALIVEAMENLPDKGKFTQRLYHILAESAVILPAELAQFFTDPQ